LGNNERLIMTNKTYVVTGATGSVGKVVVKKLKAQGHQVRPVSRSSGVSFDDAAALKRAFSRVDGAFLMIPFDMKTPDLHKRENERRVHRCSQVHDAAETAAVIGRRGQRSGPDGFGLCRLNDRDGREYELRPNR
jgi:uncharacterized protein YbjT (DUF2867 family)